LSVRVKPSLVIDFSASGYEAVTAVRGVARSVKYCLV